MAPAAARPIPTATFFKLAALHAGRERAPAMCSGRKPFPTSRPTRSFTPGMLHRDLQLPRRLRGTGILEYFRASPLWAWTCKNWVARVGNSRRHWTRASIASVTCPARSPPVKRFAVATASWIARLMPTPPAGDMAWAASPMHSNPGRCHCRRRLICTDSNLIWFQSFNSATRSAR